MSNGSLESLVNVEGVTNKESKVTERGLQGALFTVGETRCSLVLDPAKRELRGRAIKGGVYFPQNIAEHIDKLLPGTPRVIDKSRILVGEHSHYRWDKVTLELNG